MNDLQGKETCELLKKCNSTKSSVGEGKATKIHTSKLMKTKKAILLMQASTTLKVIRRRKKRTRRKFPYFDCGLQQLKFPLQ
jgi:hypothetical protein